MIRIADVFDTAKAGGVETLEGRIGPLLFADGAQCHFVEMPPGLYVDEHTHDVGSIVFTARGRWVLCSDGVRTVMDTGSLLLFEDDRPTGYEVPFDGPAYLLIFKDRRIVESDAAFADYLRDLAARLLRRRAAGVPFRFDELDRDHPALAFARTVPGAALPERPATT